MPKYFFYKKASSPLGHLHPSCVCFSGTGLEKCSIASLFCKKQINHFGILTQNNASSSISVCLLLSSHIKTHQHIYLELFLHVNSCRYADKTLLNIYFFYWRKQYYEQITRILAGISSVLNVSKSVLRK